jgi:precorrin-2 dehydrogenase / sirohydrochlorin ferrochelatase
MIHYPIVLVNLDHAFVIGGGAIATRKIAGLLDAGASFVTVIAPQLSTQIETWIAENRVSAIRRAYAHGDLANARLVIAATNDTRVNEAIWREAIERGILVNVVDDPPHCNFHVPAIVRRGNLAVAISSGGASPALSKHLRHEIENVIGDEYAQLSALLAELRTLVQANVPQKQREELWHALIEATLPLLRDGRTDEARHVAEKIIAKYKT